MRFGSVLLVLTDFEISPIDSDSFIRALKYNKLPRAAALQISISRLQEPDLNLTGFGLTPVSSEYRGPYRTGNISPRPADLSDENIVQGELQCTGYIRKLTAKKQAIAQFGTFPAQRIGCC